MLHYETGRKRSREKEQAKSAIASPSSITPSDSRSVADSSDVSARLLETMEKQVEVSRQRARRSDVNEKILNIKAILEESGDFMDDNEKQAMRKKLFELLMLCIKDGEGGSGV